MKLRISPHVVRVAATPLVKAIASSWRFEVRDEGYRTGLVAASQPFVFLLWHEALLPLLWYHRGQGIAIVVSAAREGRYLGDFASGIGYRLLQGSSTRGGARALLGAVRALQQGDVVAFTPDGPRGPARVVKPGIVRAAQDTGAMILPVHAIASPAWRLRSWDRLAIPKPWSCVRVAYGAPFAIAAGASLGEGVAACERSLANLEKEMTR